MDNINNTVEIINEALKKLHYLMKRWGEDIKIKF